MSQTTETGPAAAGDKAPVVILYRDEVGDEFNARSLSVSVDFEQVVNREKDASELHSADYRRIWGGSAPVGDHVLIVEAVMVCKRGADVVSGIYRIFVLASSLKSRFCP